MSLENSASILPDYVDTEALKSEADLRRKDFQNALDRYTPEAMANAAKKVEGAATELDSYVIKMDNVIKWFFDKNTEMKRVLGTTSTESSDYATVFNAKKAEVAELKKKVEAERELEAIRQEQVASLENRNAANYHTSWMGLERPMKSESHVGLLVAAGAFAFFAIIAIYYILSVRFEGSIPDIGRFFRGGFRSIVRKGRYSM